MDYPQIFRFKTRNKIPLIQKMLAGLAVFLMGGPVCYYVFSHMLLLGPWWMMAILFVTLIGISIVLAYILADRNPLDEIIQLDADSVTSQRYGKIDLNEILYSYDKTYGSHTHLLEIKLADGRKMKWQTTGIKDNKTAKATLHVFLGALNNAKETYKEKNGESFPKNYRFSFIRPAGFLYALICFLFFPILFIFDDINDLGFWVAPIILIPVIAGMILFIKKTVKKEQITLYKDHLISKQYGRIDFASVRTIVTSDSKVSPSASLILSDEKEIKWGSFNFGSSNKEATTRKNMEFWQFSEDLGYLLDYKNVVAIPQKQSPPTSKSPASTPLLVKQEHTKVAPEAKSVPPPKIKHVRKRKAAYIGIPVGFVVILMVFARQCGDMFKDHPLKDAAKYSRQSREEALGLLKGFTRKNGPYFMLTNDTTVSLLYFPERKKTRLQSFAEQIEAQQQDVVPKKLQNINAGFELHDQMQYAQRHPDSVQWYMTLLLHQSSLIPLTEHFWNQKDSTDIYLYVACYASKIKGHFTPTMAAYRRNKGLSDSIEVKKVCAIPIYQHSDFEESITGMERQLLMAMMHIYRDNPETTQIYIVAKAREGAMTYQRFKELVKDFKQFCKDKEVPLPELQLRTIE